MSRPPIVCIFCGKPGSSKQHIFLDRYRRILPRVGRANYTDRTYLQHQPASVVVSGYHKEKQGDVGRITCKKVCGRCNRGWIRTDIEEPAYPIVEALILDRKADLDAGEIVKLRNYLALFAAVADQDDPKMVAISETDRTHIYVTKTAPAHWQFFIGKSWAPSWRMRFRHHAMTQIGLGGLILPRPLARNTQITTLGIGTLAAQIISWPPNGDAPVKDPDVYAAELGLRYLDGTPIDLKSMSPLSEPEMLSIADRTFVAMAIDTSEKIRSGQAFV